MGRGDRATRGRSTPTREQPHLSGGPAMNETIGSATKISRRALLTTGGALAVGAQLPGPWASRAAAQSAPLRLGFQVHRTGIGAVYGRWYERTTAAAVKLINEKGGIGGGPVEDVAGGQGEGPEAGARVVRRVVC